MDEYKAPVVAAWRAGTGRVLCYTGEADGKFVGPMAKWKEAGDYYVSLARWAVGPAGPLADNMQVTQEVRNGVSLVRLHLDPDRKGEVFTGLPRVTVLRSRGGGGPRSEALSLRWEGPDTLAASIPLRGTETLLTTVHVPGQPAVRLPPVCLPYSPEFQPVERDLGLAALERLGLATGGKERVELPGTWKELPRLPRLVTPGPWLAVAALVLLLLEVLERRTGLLSREGRRFGRLVGQTVTAGKRWRIAEPSQPAEAPATPVAPVRPSQPVRPTVAELLPAPAAPSAPAPAPAPPPKRGDLLDAIRQAKRRSRERTES
jgi:hypothetical protein